MKITQTKMSDRHYFLKCIDQDYPALHGNRRLKQLHVLSNNYKRFGHKNCKHSEPCQCEACIPPFKVPAASVF